MQMHSSRLPQYLYFQRSGGYSAHRPPWCKRAWYCAHEYKNTHSIYIFAALVTLLNTKANKLGTHFISYYTESNSDNVINALGNVWSGIPDNTCFLLFFVWKGQVSHIVGSKATAYYGQFTVESYSEALRLKYYIINGDWKKV